ncbi:hypothetical protein HanIR_Chr05g0216271 [Helianthus annuus]|nr:hypothetical protein HanIR_Chr05g0216271 [Helianthus annuus]
MSDRSIGCCEPHTWASVWLHVVTMSFRRRTGMKYALQEIKYGSGGRWNFKS